MSGAPTREFVSALEGDIAALASARRSMALLLQRRCARRDGGPDPATLRIERVARMLDARIRLKAEQLVNLHPSAATGDLAAPARHASPPCAPSADV